MVTRRRTKSFDIHKLERERFDRMQVEVQKMDKR